MAAEPTIYAHIIQVVILRTLDDRHTCYSSKRASRSGRYDRQPAASPWRKQIRVHTRTVCTPCTCVFFPKRLAAQCCFICSRFLHRPAINCLLLLVVGQMGFCSLLGVLRSTAFTLQFSSMPIWVSQATYALYEEGAIGHAIILRYTYLRS